ncbi:FUSC family protein [Hyalangium versicolor]|uniref:FUSC family protein n=1 Tax=Hyalangium versicolor TaxID=2861190 RepID=UPI001CC96478|nr:FUSC family protein [Hyalangium versicolor]
MRAHAFQPSYLWDRLITSDPDLARLKMGLRALLGMGLSLVAIVVLGGIFHQPVALAMAGVMTGMTVPINVQDVLHREQRITLLSALPVAVAAVCLGTLAAASLTVSTIVFLLVAFLAVSARRFGPRGLALGMIAFMTLFLSLFFHAPVAQLPWVVASVVVASVTSYGVRLWLVPDRFDTSVRRTFSAFRRSITLLLADFSDGLALSSERRRDKLFRRAVWRVNENALAVEQQLENASSELRAHGLRPAELREYMLDLELTAERLAFEIHRCLDLEALSPEERRALGERLVALRRELRDGGKSLDSAVASSAHATAIDTALSQLRELFSHAPQPRSEELFVQEEIPAQDLATPGSEPAPLRLHPTTRQAIQATVACGLALFAGHRVSSTRWYWAVITSFVIFNRASTQGDILLRAWHRILGTVIGVVAGILLATTVSGLRDLEFALIFVCVFLGFYLIRVSYAWMVFWFTALLSVLYSLLGRYSPGLLFLRVEETLIGASIGVVVAVVLLPSRTGPRVQRAAVETLHSVASFLEASAVLPGSLAVERVREIDAKLKELRDAARPRTARKFLADRNTLRLVHALSGLIFFVRQLASACVRLPGNSETVRALEAQLAKKTRAIASSLEGQEGIEQPQASGGAIQSAREALSREQDGATSHPPRALHWLERIDDALLEVYESLGGFRSRRRETWAKISRKQETPT